MNEVESLHWQRPVPGAAIFLWHDFLRPSATDDLLKYLLEQVPWRQDTVRVFGKRYPLPRLQQWYGDPKTTYRWSGLAMIPLAWTPELNKARELSKRPPSMRSTLSYQTTTGLGTTR